MRPTTGTCRKRAARRRPVPSASGALTKAYASPTVLAPPVNIVPPVEESTARRGRLARRRANDRERHPDDVRSVRAPDRVHTSYVVGVVWMDTNLLTAQLYPGSQIPGGGPFWHNAPISAARSKTLVAAFNSGFVMQNAHGGYFTDDRTYKKLRNGAASVVIFKNGRMVVAKWGRDVLMTNQIASVRQNLDLIVDNSKEVPGLRNPKSTHVGKGHRPERRRLAFGTGHHEVRRTGLRGRTRHVTQRPRQRDAARRRRRGDGTRLRPRLGPALDLHRRARQGHQRE